MYVNGLMVSRSKLQFSDPSSSPGGKKMDLLFNSEKVNLLFKTNGGRDRRSNFFILVVWSALIVGKWVVVVWSRKSCLGPAEISSFVFLV